MPVVAIEKFESRHLSVGKNPSLELNYSIIGTDDETEAKNALLSAMPPTYGSWSNPPFLFPSTVSVEPDGPGLWKGTVNYGPLEYEAPPTGEECLAFDTTGGTQHITQSLSTIAKYAPSGKTAPDYKGAIGVTKDSVEGVDIVVPVFAFTEVHPFNAISQAYKMAVYRATGKTNNAPFRGFDTGEVLFRGCVGERRGNKVTDKWELTFHFAAQENQTDIAVGDITGISKKGWEYMWIRYDDVTDGLAMALVKHPMAVYIEQVYKSTSFGALCIGS